MVDLTCEAVDKTTQVCVDFELSGACHVELDKFPKSNSTKSITRPKRLLVEFVFVSVFRIKRQKTSLVLHFSTNQMQIKSNKLQIGVNTLVKMSPNVLTRRL